MPKFNANLSMMFTEVDFLERFGAAAKAGFKGVEFLFPYEFAADRILEQLHKHDLQMVLFNMPPGDWAAGDRGLACDPAKVTQFQENIGKAVEYAKDLDCSNIHCMAGLKPRGVSED